jgi:phosphatidylserine/phosphatidylglycerophosphate/cardiolipin synthase-like enzyme
LHHTTDSFAELASQARRRFVIASPFVDREGLDWIESLFDATAVSPSVKILIVRARDATSITTLGERAPRLRSRGVTILKYDIEHDRSLRQLGYESFHAKILLADDDKAYVGSSNMNRYSREHSLECGVVIRGPGARPISALVDAIISIAEGWK